MGKKKKEPQKAALDSGDSQEVDYVNHPSHYTHGPIEVIEVIEGFKLNYHLGTVVKYILRVGHKFNDIEDLKKARWFLTREIERREKEANADARTED